MKSIHTNTKLVQSPESVTEKRKIGEEEAEIKEYTRCLRCNRKLKDAESKKIGYGKICFEKSKRHLGKRLF